MKDLSRRFPLYSILPTNFRNSVKEWLKFLRAVSRLADIVTGRRSQESQPPVEEQEEESFYDLF